MGKLLKKGFAVLMLAVMLSWAPGSQVSEASWLGDVIGVLVGAGSSSSSSSSGKSSSSSSAKSDGTDSNWVHDTNSDQKLFIMAIKNHDYDLAQNMLDAGININAVYDVYNSGLYSAVEYSTGSTVLMYAIENRDRELQQWLLTHGANVKGYYGHKNACTFTNKGYNTYVSYIVYAAERNDLELVTYLHNWGAPINEVDGLGRNALLSCIAGGSYHDTSIEKRAELLKYLLKENINISQRTNWGANLIEWIVCNGDDSYIPMMKAAIQAGVNVNNVNQDGETPYKIAVDKHKLEMAKLLRELGGH